LGVCGHVPGGRGGVEQLWGKSRKGCVRVWGGKSETGRVGQYPRGGKRAGGTAVIGHKVPCQQQEGSYGKSLPNRKKEDSTGGQAWGKKIIGPCHLRKEGH